VEVEVLDQGSRGLFGIGSRHARIRLAVKSTSEETSDISTASEADELEAETSLEMPSLEESPPIHASTEDIPTSRKTAPVYETVLEEVDSHDLKIARDTVQELLEKMKVRAEVTAHFGEKDEERDRIPIFVDVRGDDLSILIGRRAETLNALQYISNLIISKELGRSASVIIDVEGYRVRREGQIRQLARRMADQAVKTGRRQVLEPMPANERRIIHIELRSNPQVETESIGEEPRRKVTIIPKE
jgi:spoIIIJ-associated protein